MANVAMDTACPFLRCPATFGRGSGGKNVIFSNSPNSIFEYSNLNRYQYDFLKVLLKKNPHNLPVGYVKY